MALSFALNTSSCSDFLQVEPTGSLTEEQVFEKIDNVEPLVLGLYKSYRGCKEGRNGLMPYLGTDETQQGNYQLISSGDQAGMDKYNGLHLLRLVLFGTTVGRLSFQLLKLYMHWV